MGGRRPPHPTAKDNGRHFHDITADDIDIERIVRDFVPRTQAVNEKAPNPRLAADLTNGVETAVDRGQVVHALVEFTESEMDEVHVGPANFTSAPDANQFLLDDPFAFLLGVVFDQNLPAEFAWRTPYDLRQRLGHLDPYQMADDCEAVRRALGITPKPHRIAEDMSACIVSVARIVCEEYQGDASAIWQGNPTARVVQDRLARLPGIGPTKAAMAVQMLKRDCGVAVRDVAGSDIAYDTHARRVLLRTGLAHVDELDHMQAVVRGADPTRGAGIGLPAWKIGRTWCRAEIQWCESCPVTAVCPKRIDATPGATVLQRSPGNGAQLPNRIDGCA